MRDVLEKVVRALAETAVKHDTHLMLNDYALWIQENGGVEKIVQTALDHIDPHLVTLPQKPLTVDL